MNQNLYPYHRALVRFVGVIALFICLLSASARAGTLFTSAFDGNTGAAVLPGNTDNTTGSATVGIMDWVTDSSVTSISGLTAISTGSGGFAQLQGGTATYANGDSIYISRNLNLDTSPQRGFSLSFTIDSPSDLETLTILSGHSTNTGNQDQAYLSDLFFSLTGGSLGAPVTGSSTEDYAVGPAYHTVAFDLTGTTINAGSYNLDVYQSNLVGGGAYAIYDGITLTAVPEPSAALLGGLAMLALFLRRR
jgi:hypothetical protein